MVYRSVRPKHLGNISHYCLAAAMLTSGGESIAGESERFNSVRKEVFADDDKIVLGLGAALSPRFEGADDYRVSPVPMIDAQKGRFFIRTGVGIGLHIIDTPHFLAGASMDWMQGYDEEDVPDGVGELDGAAGGKLFASTRVGGMLASLSGTQVLDEGSGETGELKGLVVDASLSYPYPATERLMLIPATSVSWANARYMDSYFGINASRATESGLEAYEPSADIKDVSIRVGFNYRLSGDWNLTGAIGFSRLMGEAADSPLVESMSQANALLGVSYTF